MNWHPDRPPMLWHDPWWHTWQGVIPILLVLVLGAVVIWMAVRMNRMQAAAQGAHAAGSGSAASAPAAAPTDPALEHARMRYANGEIDRDTFLSIWTDLGGAPVAGGTPGPEAGDDPDPGSA